MAFTLDFAQLIGYDPSQAGIQINVGLSLIESRTEVSAKIDTGSTDCVFTRSSGEQIGLNIETGLLVKVSTATGYLTTYRHFVSLSVLGYEFDVGICFAGDENYKRNVLGRHGFLDRVILGLVDYEGKLYLSKYGEPFSLSPES